MLHKIMEILCFSANVHQCDIAFCSLCMCKFVFKSILFIYYYVSLLPARVAANNSVKSICTSGWFVLPVGLYFRLVCANGK